MNVLILQSFLRSKVENGLVRNCSETYTWEKAVNLALLIPPNGSFLTIEKKKRILLIELAINVKYLGL